MLINMLNSVASNTVKQGLNISIAKILFSYISCVNTFNDNMFYGQTTIGLVSKIDLNERKQIIYVDRINVLDGAVGGFQRVSFKDNAGMSVRSSGKHGIDEGGPNREFMRLALQKIRDSAIFH